MTHVPFRTTENYRTGGSGLGGCCSFNIVRTEIAAAAVVQQIIELHLYFIFRTKKNNS